MRIAPRIPTVGARKGAHHDVSVCAPWREADSLMEFVEFRGGLLVREDAVALYLSLDARGHVLTEPEPGKLIVSNGSALTAEDRAQITQLKAFLIALTNYKPPEGETT